MAEYEILILIANPAESAPPLREDRRGRAGFGCSAEAGRLPWRGYGDGRRGGREEAALPRNHDPRDSFTGGGHETAWRNGNEGVRCGGGWMYNRLR